MGQTTALDAPENGLIEHYELFTRLRQARSDDVRRELAFQVVLHPTAMRRLRTAARYQRRLTDGAADFEELVQEAMLQLVLVLAARSLPFRDLGVRPFRRWYWTLCTNGVRQAVPGCRRLWLPSLESLNEESLDVPRPAAMQLRWEDVIDAISEIRHPLMKAVMADMAAGKKAYETVLTRKMSSATVAKMRRRGLMLLRSRFG